jgi:folate-binding protein YgfZ
VIRLHGPDARTLLQGLVSNDVERLAADRALYAALLTPQGKYLFDFLLFAHGEEVLLDVEAARLPALVQRLTLYRLRARVQIEDASGDWAVLALPAAGAAGRFALEAAAGAAREEDDAVVAVDPRLAALGVRALVRREALDGFVAAHGLVATAADAYDRHRLRLGVPDGSRDLVVEKSILLESGFEELNGVSFTKGCFVGQELTARTKHRALIKKRLVPVAVTGPLPEPGTQVTRDGRDAGEVRSGRDGVALALLRLEHLGRAEDGGAPLAAGEATLRPEIPPWLRIRQDAAP